LNTRIVETAMRFRRLERRFLLWGKNDLRGEKGEVKVEMRGGRGREKKTRRRNRSSSDAERKESRETEKEKSLQKLSPSELGAGEVIRSVTILH